ncbi:hypothetical protein C8R45DRAFT_922986 [Mycena sanguinolenta]|nr:hypothetical protein C8R45DRAFT_922986 [Mycena sanguinolenta]
MAFAFLANPTNFELSPYPIGRERRIRRINGSTWFDRRNSNQSATRCYFVPRARKGLDETRTNRTTKCFSSRQLDEIALLDTMSNQLDSPIMTDETETRLRAVEIFYTFPLGDMWTLMWPWMELLDRHHDTLHSLSPEDMHTIFIPLIVGILHKYRQVSRSMHATPRLCYVIGKEWVQLLQTANFNALESIYRLLSIWFSNRNCRPTSFDELVIGVGCLSNSSPNSPTRWSKQ